jgi:integrase
MTTKKLTATGIDKIQLPASGRKIHWDSLVPGFGLQVTDKGSRTWLLMGRLHGTRSRRLVKLSFGRPGRETVAGVRIYTLADARRRAHELKEQLDHGIDPRETPEWRGLRQKVEPAENSDGDYVLGSFGALVNEYLEKHLKPNTRRWKDHDRNIRLYLADWMERPYSDIAASDLLEITDKFVVRDKPGAANHAYDLANRVFNWALNRRLINVSPFAGLRPPVKKRSRDRVLDEKEISALCAVDHDPLPSAFVKMLLITGQRRGSVGGMRWEEIDTDAGLWHIPAERMKNGSMHTVPLPRLALQILETLPQYVGGAFVFSTTAGKKPISGYSKLKVKIDIAVNIAPWSFHDLRRTMATQMAKIGVQQQVVEKLLDHRSGKISGIAAIYNRHDYRDEMKSAMEAWAGRLQEIADM